jgi:hypothetical protein
MPRINYTALANTTHYDYFLWADESTKTEEYLGDYGSFMAKLGRAYADAYCRADEHNLYAMRSALANAGKADNDPHNYLLLRRNDISSRHIPIFLALLLLGYNVNAVLTAIAIKLED